MTGWWKSWWCAGAAAAGVLAAGTLEAAEAETPADALPAMVRADWAAQEARLGRHAGSAKSTGEALRRTGLLLNDLRARPDAPDLAAESAGLERLRAAAGQSDDLRADTRLRLYHEVLALCRETALKNPLLAGRPLLFMKRNRFACQMLHEYIAYFNQYSGQFGGGVFLLEEPGRSLKTRDLIGGRLPPGCYTSLALSDDARTVYFAFAERTERKPAFGSPDQRYYHVYCLDVAGDRLGRLTDGPYDDIDPCPLPDGGIAILSTRRGGYTRCNNPWEPIAVYTLHRMDADGANLRGLSFHETNEWHPSVLSDGRIAYCRWDYVDRSAANYHGIWATNPDGSNPVALFGNYTSRISACFQPYAVPGSKRILFVAGAHHADVGGCLVLLDASRAALDEQSGRDRFDALEVLTPEVCFPEGSEKDGGWPKSYFHAPRPLSENYYLVGFSHDPLPRMGGSEADTTGIYYFDRFGNLELLYRDASIASTYPIPLAPHPAAPVVPSTLDPALGDEAELVLTDVSRSQFPLPPNRPIRSLRVFQVLPKTTPTANEPRIGHANAEGARMALGTVPVQSDGSAWFRVPARKPLYFQAVDGEGRAVQGMRSIVYLQPGERRSCVGCHEPRGSSPSRRTAAALAGKPAAIVPGPDGTRPFCYPRLVQPVLDRYCVRCHDGTKGAGKSALVLKGDADGPFSRSYNSLKPYLRWYEWGGESITEVATHPGRLGADESRLMEILADATHAGSLRLPPEARERLLVWLDGNVPFYGVYQKDQQRRQQAGLAVAPPETQ
jgi:cytochrome c553